MNTTTAITRTGTTGPGVIRRFAQHHPIVAFSVGAFGIGWPLLAISTVRDDAPIWVRLAFPYLALLGSALVVSRLVAGPGAGRRLITRIVRWRFGVGRWAVIVFGMPVLTLVVAAASGTLQTPANGWLGQLGQYLFSTIVYGALMVNIAEEAGWAGFVQTRLAADHSVLRGALATAPLFVAMHLPMQFVPGWTWAGVGVSTALLAVVAPFFRYVIGDHLEATGGSVLAAGVQHAAFNASQQLDVPGGWQALVAVFLLAVMIADRRRRIGNAPAAALRSSSRKGN